MNKNRIRLSRTDELATQSEANKLNVFSNTGYQHGLTPIGKQQAFSVLNQLQSMGIQPKAIYSSPLKRAVETAEIIAKGFELPYEKTPELIEFSVGFLEGKSSDEDWYQFKLLWDEWFLNNNNSYQIEGGESLTDVVTRVNSFLNRLKEVYQPEDILFLIGHGGTFKAILLFLDESVSRKSLRDTWLKHTNIVKIEMSKVIRSVIIYHTENKKESDVFDTQ
ncbi:MAG: histidine phosphatase family protein [Thermotogota bacterium]|nr:histidine phosphatase family protein [Thermotogota bacterium]